MKILVKRGRNALRPQVVDVEQVREYPDPRHRPGRHVTVLSMVFQLKRDRAPDYLRVMPPEQAERLETLRAKIRRLRAEAADTIDEAWRRADPYTVPKA